VKILYNHKLTPRARILRRESTLSEVLLWKHINKKRLGYVFLRQKPIDNYIVDFYCPKLKLVIEIDGSSHDSKQEYDTFREDALRSLNLHILKYSDSDVKNNIESVIREITDWISKF
jgi:very-short-patch-repair endonuclease